MAIILANSCDNIEKNVLQLITTCMLVSTDTNDRCIRNSLVDLAIFMETAFPKISACGLFTINNKFLLTLLSATTGYIIIMLQFEKS